jgi:PIN domain nuclease of toxin-antitoxin system
LGYGRADVEMLADTMQIEVIDVDGPLALDAAEIREAARKLAMSQADCICLALGKREALPVLTADRQWLEIAEHVGVDVRLIR